MLSTMANHLWVAQALLLESTADPGTSEPTLKTLDVDAATITVDATTTTFTGDVKGPRSTGDDEFVTYAQLDSMANKAPFNETYKAYKYPGGTAQNFPTGVKTRMVLEDDGALDFYYAELSGPVTNPDDPTEPPYSIQGPTADYHMNLADKGIYQ